MDDTAAFATEQPRLLRIATQVLGDPVEAQDVVQTAWLRLNSATTAIDNLPGWLTTVTTRLCLDRLRTRTPVPIDDTTLAAELEPTLTDPLDDVVLADTVSVALHAVLDRLSPAERVAFVLHDTFGVDFPTIADILGRTPAATRKLASRARAKVAQPAAPEQHADAAVVDAFMAAARRGDFTRLLELLAPDVVATADAEAEALGSPRRLTGPQEVARLFSGGARAAFPVLVEDRPGAAWFHRGEAKVVFDFTVTDGVVRSIRFRAEPALLTSDLLSRRRPPGASQRRRSR